MTTLDGVNEILASIGRGAVRALDTGGASDAAFAERTLENVSLEVQTSGCWFNERRHLTLAPDAAGHIALPEGAISLDMRRWQSRCCEFTQLGRRLYDVHNNTDVFTAPVKAEEVLYYEFDCIPQWVQKLIVRLACERYNAQYGGSLQQTASRKQSLALETARARGEFNRREDRASNVNLLRNVNQSLARGQRAQYQR